VGRIGCPAASPETIELVRAALAGGGINSTAKALGCGNGLVARIAAELQAAVWGPKKEELARVNQLLPVEPSPAGRDKRAGGRFPAVVSTGR
jgi:hypothetical protein